MLLLGGRKGRHVGTGSGSTRIPRICGFAMRCLGDRGFDSSRTRPRFVSVSLSLEGGRAISGTTTFGTLGVSFAGSGSGSRAATGTTGSGSGSAGSAGGRGSMTGSAGFGAGELLGFGGRLRCGGLAQHASPGLLAASRDGSGLGRSGSSSLSRRGCGLGGRSETPSSHCYHPILKIPRQASRCPTRKIPR